MTFSFCCQQQLWMTALPIFHMQEMKEEIPDISQHHRVKMEGNAYGILIYDKSLATFLGAFVETNHDNLDSMLAHVIAEHKVLSLIFQLNYSFSFSFRNYIFYYIWSNTLCKAGSNMKLYWFFLSAVVMNTEFYWPQVYFEPSKPSKMDSMCAYTYVCVYVCAAVQLRARMQLWIIELPRTLFLSLKEIKFCHIHIPFFEAIFILLRQ